MINLSHDSRPVRDSVVPMINVAFLLLIFFLMTAVIAPPDPTEVTLPEAAIEAEAVAPETLVISANGALVYGQLQGDDVFTAIPGGSLRIRVDAELDGAVLARIAVRLAENGVTTIQLVTVSR